MATKAELTCGYGYDEINRIIRYDAERGKMFWRVDLNRSNHPVKAGEEVTPWMCNGYPMIILGNKRLYLHRVAVLLMTGSWPKEYVDHANMDKGDFRWSNLREANDQQNRTNTKSRSKWGVKGVYKVKHYGFAAELRNGGKRHYLGLYPTLEAAHAAYWEAAQKHFGEFARAA